MSLAPLALPGHLPLSASDFLAFPLRPKQDRRLCPAFLATCPWTPRVCRLFAATRPKNSAPAAAMTELDTRAMEGTLFKWGHKAIHIAFKSKGSFTRHVVLIGGLTDGLLPVPYTVPLGEALEGAGWGLVQTLLSSSYIGYGTSSLEKDAREMDQLLGYLARHEGCTSAVIIGHSTGCQDIVHYAKRKENEHQALLKGAILQGPASDREYMATQPDTEQWLALAQAMLAEGKAQELMPRAANPWAPITAKRYASLAGRDGPDDLFSSDFSEDELHAKLHHMSAIPTLVLFSDSDEYVPTHVDKALLLKRLCHGLGGARGVLVKGGDHALYSGQAEAISAITSFLKESVEASSPAPARI